MARGLLRLGVALLAAVSASSVAAPAPTVAREYEVRDCGYGITWPNAPRDLQGFTFLGHTTYDRFGALRIAVDRVLHGEVPDEVLIVRSCVSERFEDGQELLVSAASDLAEDPTGDDGPLRLWLTKSASAIWRVQDSGRLVLAGQEGRGNAPQWLLGWHFTADVVDGVLGDEAPAPDALLPGGRRTDSGPLLPPLAGPTPSGPAWTAGVLTGGRGTLEQIVRWRGGYAALGHDVDPSGWQPRWRLWTSTDGRTWNAVWRQPPGLTRDIEMARIIGHRGGLTVVAGVTSGLAVWRSKDGRRYRRLPDQPGLRRPPRLIGPSEYSFGLGSLTASRGRLRVAGSWRYHDCLSGCPLWDVTWTSADGRTWRRTATPVRTSDGAFSTPVVTTPSGYAAMGAGWCRPDADETVCRHALWRSRDGVRWRPMAGANVQDRAPVALATDRATGRMLLLVSGRDEPAPGLFTLDADGWRTVDVPFPLGWSGAGIAVSGDTIVLTGSRWFGTDDVRAEAIVSVDGGASWSVSAGWPALFDGVSAPLIAEDLIVAGAGDPTGVAWLAR